jgi:CelD/BcsL family acetyltransferase involved in cellulose biosynthesis
MTRDDAMTARAASGAALASAAGPTGCAGLAILDIDDPRWVDYVCGHPAATPFHHQSWVGLVSESYRFPAFAAAVLDTRGDVIAGIPIVEVRHRPSRPRWVALPFTDHCPPLVTTADGEAALQAGLRYALASSGARSMEVRGELPGVPAHQVGVRHLLRLDRDEGAVFAGFHASQVKRNIRRAQRAHVTVRPGTREQDLTETFYRLHLMTRRRQGVPVQPRRFFVMLWHRVLAQGYGTVLIAEHDGRPVAAAVFLRYNATLIYKYGASDAAAWSLRPNHALFWHAIRDGCAAGDSWLDWGRSDVGNHGLRAFKASWGAEELPLVHSVLRADGAASGSRTGRRLAPSRASTAAGALISHSPPLVCRIAGRTLYRYTA